MLTAQKDHPRIRGEHLAWSGVKSSSLGSSPHTRGAPRPLATRVAWVGIIPAYAGSTRVAARRWTSPWDHPRIRGEHASWPETETRSPGSSPHTRGAPGMPLPAVAAGGIIPAYAGSTSG